MPGAALALIRHAPTVWNEDGLVQGHSDIPLSPRGQAAAAGWQVPAELDGYAWTCSPLLRARETAALLGAVEPVVEPRLIEMSWGAWEGRTLPDLRAELGDLMVAWEADGLDFRAPGGESPRDVQTRLRPWLCDVAGQEQPTIAVTHKGVIRALYAMAVDWDMTDKPPHKLRDDCAHLFAVEPDGRLGIAALNLPLDTKVPA